MPVFKFDVNVAVATNIKKLIEKNNINNLVICALLNLKPSSVSDLLSGEVNWKLEHLVKLCEYFAVSLDKLVFDDEDYINKLAKKSEYEFKEAIKEYLVREKKYKTFGELSADGFFDILTDK